MANTSSSGRSTPASLPEVVRRFWWPVYGEARSHGHPPVVALRICAAVLGRSKEGGSFLRSEDYDGRLRLVMRGELARILAQPESIQTALVLEGISLPDAEARDDYVPSPERRGFNDRWKVVVLEQALAALHSAYQAEGRQELFQRLRPALTRNVGADPEAPELERLRQRLRDEVRRLVAETVTTPTGLEAELAELFGET